MNNSFKINNFDLLRILAATQVVGAHIFGHMGLAAPNWWSAFDGFPGVPVFFVISGFLISASYERSSSLKNYARNRVLRIYPGLWCCVLLTTVVAICFGFNFLNRAAPVWFASQLVGVIYTPRFLQHFGFGSYNGALWTIPIELQFYLVLPAVYWLVRKARNEQLCFWLIWSVFVVLSVLLRWLFPQMDSDVGPQKLVRYSFFPHFYLFLTGVLLQRAAAYKRNWIAGKALYWVVGYLGLVFLVRFFAPAAALPYAAETTACMLVLAIATVAAAYTVPGASHRILRGNDISYGVYIYHGLIMNALIELGLIGRPRYAVLLICCTYIAGYLSWIVVERRFLRRKQQTISPRFNDTPQPLKDLSRRPMASGQ